VQFMDRLKPTLDKNEKYKQWIITYHWQWEWVEYWTNHREWGWGKDPNSPQVEARWGTSIDSSDGLTRNLPKWCWWITELVSWDWGKYTKLNCPTLLGEELTRQSCSSRTMQLPPGENNRSDHLEQTGNELQ
jgi:hypothetical protein